MRCVLRLLRERPLVGWKRESTCAVFQFSKRCHYPDVAMARGLSKEKDQPFQQGLVSALYRNLGASMNFNSC